MTTAGYAIWFITVIISFYLGYTYHKKITEIKLKALGFIKKSIKEVEDKYKELKQKV